MDILDVLPRERYQPDLVAKATGVVEHMAEGDGVSVRGNLGNPFADIVVEREIAFFGGQHGAGGGELLGDRTHVEDRFGRERPLELEAPHAVAAFVDELTVAHHSHGATGRVRLVIGGKDAVHTALRLAVPAVHLRRATERRQQEDDSPRSLTHSPHPKRQPMKADNGTYPHSSAAKRPFLRSG